MVLIGTSCFVHAPSYFSPDYQLPAFIVYLDWYLLIHSLVRYALRWSAPPPAPLWSNKTNVERIPFILSKSTTIYTSIRRFPKSTHKKHTPKKQSKSHRGHRVVNRHPIRPCASSALKMVETQIRHRFQLIKKPRAGQPKTQRGAHLWLIHAHATHSKIHTQKHTRQNSQKPHRSYVAALQTRS